MASALEKSLKARQGSTQSLASASIKTNTATGGSALAKSIAARSAQSRPTLTTTANIYASDEEKKRQEEKNKGGLLGGIGYVGEKVGLGILQGVEGIFDYVGAGILDLFGADDAAEDVLENDWVNYSHADEWFNPGEGWKVAGDVAGGIGTSIPGLAAGVVAGVATGGASLVPTIAGLATSGLSAAGTSTKEAFQESGELGLKEFGYGAIMGGVEAGTEWLSGKIGAGILKNADDIAAAFGKTASKTAKAVSAKTIAASLGKEFASEAFEEGFAEFVSPYAKRLTYDPNAKNATIEEISYAALVGGLSGIVMGGGTTTITQTTNLARGSKAVDAGRVTSIMDTAKAFSDYEGTSPTKLSSMEAIHDLYTRLESQGVRESTKLTVNQRRAIGELQSLTTSAVFEPAMQKSAISAIEGADLIAQKLNADGQIKIVDGKMQAVTADSLAELQKQGVEVRDITADDIRGGVDVKDGKSVAKAMKENDLLRYIAASDVAGRFMMTAKEVETAARAGTKIRSQADLNNYIENATPEMKAALGAELGIADNEWATLKLQRFNEAAAAYRESGKLDAKRAEIQAKEKASEEAKRMSMDSVGETAEQTTAKTKVAEVKERIEAKKIDEYLRENIEGYSSLGEANKSMIRQIVREGRATGVSDEDTVRYAKVAARSGLNIVFDSSLKEGEAGYFDPKNNRIVVNPKSEKKGSMILIHELDHALRAYLGDDGKIHYVTYKDVDKKLSKKTWKQIKEDYADQDIEVSREELFADEASAYYTEALIGTDKFIDLLLGKEPALKEKILDFFRGAIKSYSKDAELAKAARQHYRNFKKMFDAFSAVNQGRNAETAGEGIEMDEKSVAMSKNFATFIDSVMQMKRKDIAAKRRFVISEVSDSHAKIVESVIKKELHRSIDLTGYKIVINGDAVLHITDRHGAFGEADNSLTSVEDIASIGWAVNNAESGEIARKKNGNIDYSYVYKNSDNTAAPKILMKTALSDGETFFITECVPDSEKKEIHIISARKVKSGNGQVLNVESNDSPQPTSETPLDYDAASDISIPQSAEKSTPSAKKVSENSSKLDESARKSMDITPEIEAARGSIVMDLSSYKPKGRKETIEYGKAVGDDAYTRFQIQATNQQAGLEKELKRLGVKNGEALVQSARSASNAAATMIGDAQMRIGDGSYEVQGEGLEKIYHPILNGDAIESELKGLSKKEREARLEEYSSDFFAYLFHMHSADRMSLEQRSIDENNERIKTLDKKVKRRTEVEAEIKSKGDAIDEIASSRTKENNAKRKELRDEWRKLRAEKAQLDRDIKNLMKEVAEFVPAENKPVLGHVVDADGKTVLTTADGEAIPYTAEESKAIAEEILKLHPEFKEAAEKVWAYNKNLNQYRVDAGLISQESFDRMQELYPHYVPTYREGSRTGIAAMSGKYALKVKATVKSAKGGLRPLCRPDVIMARQTEETIKAGRVNQLARTYYDAAEPEIENGVNAIRVISRVDAKADETIDFDPTTIAPKNNRVTFYKNGEKIEMEVDKNVFDGFDAFNSQTDMGGIITGAFGKVMNLYKRLITSYSPIFTIRNAIRDLQDAGINTKYGKTFLRNYKRAMKEIRSNGKYWQMYRAAGGLSSSLFDFERGFGGSTNSWGLTKAEGTPWQKLGTTIENANVFIEQLPRLAEFISSMEANNSIEQAILDAADVTTNFGRSGKMARWLNRNFIPFLNPSIQGFSKLVRNVTDRKTAKELVAFLLKAALLGFAPQIINQLFLGDDDEYEKLRDSDKENNYIIRIPGREEFIKIPKGRVVAAMSGIVNRTANTLQGKEDAWEGYLDSVLQNITPVDSASRDILSPFRDVKANKTWYGTEIEGRQFENVPVEERTDEGTSWIAEVLAQLPTSKAAELSPKKIHYLIDQYTGIIGDVVLPATSKKAQKDMLSGAFVIDPVVSNDLSNRFYNQYDKAVQTKNSTKSTEEELEIASFRYKYLGKIKDTVSDMQKAKREIQASDLKATEKLKQTREIQAAINLLYEEALNDIDKLTELYNGTYYLGAADIYSNYVASGITDEQYASLRYAETIRSYYGAETALSQYNSAVYEKATLFNKAGLDYDTYYEYYFSTRGIESDVDKKGEVVSGSKKKKTLAAIKALGVSQTERLLLTAAAGYSLTESEKKRLISYINKLAVTKDEKIAIAEACGFTVKNGRISLK